MNWIEFGRSVRSVFRDECRQTNTNTTKNITKKKHRVEFIEDNEQRVSCNSSDAMRNGYWTTTTRHNGTHCFPLLMIIIDLYIYYRRCYYYYFYFASLQLVSRLAISVCYLFKLPYIFCTLFHNGMYGVDSLIFHASYRYTIRSVHMTHKTINKSNFSLYFLLL